LINDGATQLAADLAEELAATHRRVHELDVGGVEKPLASRRLRAINEVAEHDVTTASRRLRTFVRDLDEPRNSLSNGSNEA
jgi:hypothetical protein